MPKTNIKKRIKKMSHRALTAKIYINETNCGFVYVTHSLPESCYTDKGFIHIFDQALKIIEDDIMPIQTRKRMNDATRKQRCEILFKRPASPTANVSVGVMYDSPLRINKPTVYESIKHITLPAIAERLDHLITSKHGM